eukprot:4950645-Prymnesium_polylepis.2
MATCVEDPSEDRLPNMGHIYRLLTSTIKTQKSKPEVRRGITQASFSCVLKALQDARVEERPRIRAL